MRALPSAGVVQLRLSSSRRPPLGRQPSGRRPQLIAPATRSSVAASVSSRDEGEEMRRRPPTGHPLAFGEPGPPAASSPTAPPLSWPSLDLASVAAALARSDEARRLERGGGGSSSSDGKRDPKGASRLPGGVHLVGTGPGDAGLLTLRAVALLAEADVVLYDRLVSPEILALVNPGARMVYVGKAKGLHTRTQEEIHDLLVAFACPEEPEEPEEGGGAGDGGGGGGGESGGGEAAAAPRRHPIVLRLKGGDPLVFGRGGEEATALRAAGVPVQTVPGISAAGGVAASLGIPLTHRGVATSVRLLTGHARPGGEEGLAEDIERVAASPDSEHTTLVVYMGLATLRETSGSLVRSGMAASTPAVAVERGTTARQRVVYATVADLPRAVEAAALVSPTLIIIGGVVALSPGWQEAFGAEGAGDAGSGGGAVSARASLSAAVAAAAAAELAAAA